MPALTETAPPEFRAGPGGRDEKCRSTRFGHASRTVWREARIKRAFQAPLEPVHARHPHSGPIHLQQRLIGDATIIKLLRQKGLQIPIFRRGIIARHPLKPLTPDIRLGLKVSQKPCLALGFRHHGNPRRIESPQTEAFEDRPLFRFRLPKRGAPCAIGIREQHGQRRPLFVRPCGEGFRPINKPWEFRSVLWRTQALRTEPPPISRLFLLVSRQLRFRKENKGWRQFRTMAPD